MRYRRLSLTLSLTLSLLSLTLSLTLPLTLPLSHLLHRWRVIATDLTQ